MGTAFVLVRHGQTEWNRVERFRGRADIPLNETGRTQAAQAARHLSGEPIVAVYSGPLGRTLATAQPIAEALGLPVQPLAGLVDIDYGAWQGLTPEEAAGRYPADYARWLSHPAQVRFPGGESLDDVRVRAMTAIESLAERHDGSHVVLVGHKIVNKVVLCAVLGLPNDAIWRIEQDNGAINRFEIGDGVWVVQLVNDTCHL